MGILGDIIGGVSGLFSDKKKNKRAKEQNAIAQQLANQQVDISKYIQGLSQELMGRGTSITMPDGSVVGYDAASGTYRAPLSAADRGLQDASNAEELKRLTVDQDMRRGAIQDAEGRRQRAGTEADTAMRDLSLFKQGVGKVDPDTIVSALRSSRTGAVNAGFDDAAKAASMLGARTGSSSISDALSAIGRNRSKAIMETAGTPEVEGLGYADELNKSRLGEKMGLYSRFSDDANKFYDASFAPSDAEDQSYARAIGAQQLDLSKYNTAMGGSGTAAAGIGSAANTSRSGYLASEANRVSNPTGRFASGLDDALGSTIGKLFGGGFGF